MDLEDRIARLIDHTTWQYLDDHKRRHKAIAPHFARTRKHSLRLARRVIDELHLKKNEFITLNGPVKGIIKGHINQEDQ